MRKMKKTLKFTAFAAALVFAASVLAFTAFAETEDVELSVKKATYSSGSWGQSLTYSPADFKATRITPESQVRIEFELDGEYDETFAPVELIFQNYTVDPQIWAKIDPAEFTDTTAVFNYDAIVLAYGSDDFTDVGNVIVGDRGQAKVLVTKFTVTNCTVPEVSTAVSETESETAAAPEETQGTEASQTTVAEAENSGASSVNVTVIIIIAGAAVVIAAGIIVAVIVVKKNRRRFY